MSTIHLNRLNSARFLLKKKNKTEINFETKMKNMTNEMISFPERAFGHRYIR